MKKIIQRYLSRDIRVQILLKPKKSQIKNLKISKSSDNFLGFSTWIKSADTQNFQEVKYQFDTSHVN